MAFIQSWVGFQNNQQLRSFSGSLLNYEEMRRFVFKELKTRVLYYGNDKIRGLEL